MRPFKQLIVDCIYDVTLYINVIHKEVTFIKYKTLIENFKCIELTRVLRFADIPSRTRSCGQ